MWGVVVLTATLASAALAALSPLEAASLERGVFRVLRLRPTTHVQVAYLDALYQKSAQLKMDFWQPPVGVGAAVDVMVGDKELGALETGLASAGLNATVIIPDVEKLTKERAEKAALRAALFPRRRDSASRVFYDFQHYHETQDMLNYMEAVARKYPAIAQLEHIGYSHENRPLHVLKIGNHDRTWGKRAIWIDGGMHAREWAAPHVALFFIHQLVTKYGRDAEVTHLVDNLNWFVSPMTNPDGYQHSRSNTHPNVRMWRKNRSPNDCNSRKCCKGVDLNRNFDFHWMESGSSSDPCNEVFAGTSSFSEPESRAIRDFVLRHAHELDGFITLHTYSQLWVHSFGHARGQYPADRGDLLWVHSFGHARGQYPADRGDLLITGKKAAKALKKLYGTKYKIGSGADALYPASGGSDDWAKDRAGVKFVYLLELRPSEEEWDGFILDEAELVPTGRETWEGVKVVAAEILRRSGRALPEKEEESGEEWGSGSGRECEDLRYSCPRWASSQGGENCLIVRDFMKEQCPKSCSQRFAGFC